jgi:hypothetical protein
VLVSRPWRRREMRCSLRCVWRCVQVDGEVVDWERCERNVLTQDVVRSSLRSASYCNVKM